MAAVRMPDSEGGYGENLGPQEILRLLERTPSRSFPSLVEGMEGLALAHKSSKSLGSHWLLDILAIGEPRSLVLVAALYLEHIVHRHLQHQGSLRKRKPLTVEISQMLTTGVLPHDLHADIVAVVKLRNQFVHNLYYDISEWNPLESLFLAKNPPRMPATRRLRAAKNLILLKVLLMSILFRLHDSFPWLTFEDVPAKHRKRLTKRSSGLEPSVRAQFKMA